MNITNKNGINNVKKIKKNKSLLVKKNDKNIELDDELELEFIEIQNNKEKKESNDNFDYMNDIEYIQKFISNNEKSKDVKKKQNGEVFTPYEIIIKMLNELEKTY
jgi:glycyl-tRNA synthetase alpha subunit